MKQKAQEQIYQTDNPFFFFLVGWVLQVEFQLESMKKKSTDKVRYAL